MEPQVGPARGGRPPLSERRKAQTRLDIAREAVRLFEARGVAATSVEDIAEAAGISTRTFWRYCEGKEDCVRPLLTTGVDVVAAALLEWRFGEDLATVLDRAGAAAGEVMADAPATQALLRLVVDEPALRSVWLRVHHDAEDVFAAALTRSSALPPGGLHARVGAAVVNGALRAAVEHHVALRGTEGLVDAVREALRIAVSGLRG
ncbi:MULTISPECIES: TetR/AcrR family transcriptional regulator [Actinosynnema]|uniref:TetR family transcriptional regulator n=1 Tax=Actinosynnema pretiosum TaxID=42197 RepID=A0A290Z569_9PSEU|nr:TetR/AcrR family transcriptional regulator [Actinosynnema pretiosum]ATE54134.1 TetR family transcriptional regulator [Actinosynnema pretiosum]